MKCIAIIPARGGSKRIPRKNIKPFLGKPILSYAIETALASGVCDEVMVSTDDAEIAGIAMEYGAKVPFYRSAETAGDFATTWAVLKEVLQMYEQRGMCFDYVLRLYPCAALVTPEQIREAMQMMQSMDVDEVRSVVEYSCPPQRGEILRNGYLQYWFPEFATSRCQDMEPVYHDCGQFAITRTDVVMEKVPHRGRSYPYIVSQERVQDIDNESDWRMAELKYRTFILGE